MDREYSDEYNLVVRAGSDYCGVNSSDTDVGRSYIFKLYILNYFTVNRLCVLDILGKCDFYTGNLLLEGFSSLILICLLFLQMKQRKRNCLILFARLTYL